MTVMSISMLIVEDKDDTLQAIRRMLEPLKLDIQTAQDGLDGLSKAKKDYYDIILIDHKMPVMDGFSLLKNLRELENYRNAPLLFMSTDSLVEVEPKALAAGATQCLSKPLDAEYLVDSVQNWSAKAVA